PLYATLFPYPTLFRSQRERTGKGRRIEVNMLESSIGFTPDAFAYLTQADIDYGPSSRIASSQCFAFACGGGKLLAIHLSVQAKLDRKSTRLNSSHVKI